MVAAQEAAELISEQVAPHDVPDHKHAASVLQASWLKYLKRQSMLQELPVHWHIVWAWQLAARDVWLHVVVQTPASTSHMHCEETAEHDVDVVSVLHAPPQLFVPHMHCVSRLQVV